MIKQQQLTANISLTNQLPLTHPQNFKERINQLKAKIKPRISLQVQAALPGVTGQWMYMGVNKEQGECDPSRLEYCRREEAIVENGRQQKKQHLILREQVVKIPQRVVSQKKVIEMKVSYRKLGHLFKNIVIPKQPVEGRRLSSDCQLMSLVPTTKQEEVFVGSNCVQEYSSVNHSNDTTQKNPNSNICPSSEGVNKKNMRIHLNLNQNSTTNKQQDKENKHINIPKQKQKSCEIQDILFNGYKSPIKSERIKLQTQYKFYDHRQIKYAEVEGDREKDKENRKYENKVLIKQKQKQNLKEQHRNQKQKQQKLATNPYNLNINIDVRQCNSRTSRYTQNFTNAPSGRVVTGRTKKSLDKSTNIRSGLMNCNVRGGYKVK